VIAVDLPGFGDSVKPLRAPFDARYGLCGHVPQVERPVQTHDAIRAFLG